MKVEGTGSFQSEDHNALAVGFFAFFCFTTCLEVQAVTLVPGTYKMEWTVPPADEANWSMSFGLPAYQFHYPAAPIDRSTRRDIKGTKSKYALHVEKPPFYAILDESKGNGKGYDTLYLIPNVNTKKMGKVKLSLGQGIKIPLQKIGNALVPRQSGWMPVNLRFGAVGEQITKQALFRTYVSIGHYENKYFPSEVNIYLRGMWTGNLKTDCGDATVTVFDYNSNQIFGDRRVGSDIINNGDAFSIEYKDDYCETKCSEVILNNFVLFEGKKYDISISKTGDSIKVADYIEDRR